MSKTFGTNLTGKDGYNLFEIPFLLCFVLYSYVLVSLIGSKYFYEIPVVIFSTCIIVLWAMLYIIFEIKISNHFYLSKTKVFILIAGLFLGFYYAKVIWFSGYLNLDPVATLFEGNFHIDTLFHTDIAESFITNRYPSIQFNASDFLHYHVVSHLILACISNILKIPCFVGYNYIYPIVFLPLYVYLLQSVVVAFRRKIGSENPSRLKDIIFLLCFCLGFDFFGFSAICKLSYGSIIISESFLISIVLMLICIRIILALITDYYHIVFLLIIPVFMVLVSGAKISTGLIFYLAISYFLFRTKPKSIINWLAIFIYSIIFILCYDLFNDSLKGENGTPLYLFHYIRTWVPKKLWIFHLAGFLLPALFIFKYHTKGRLFTKEYFLEKSNVWAEISLLITISSRLPGILFEIGGGSAAYFHLPAFIISCLLLWGLNIHCDMYDALKHSSLAIPLFILSMAFFINLFPFFRNITALGLMCCMVFIFLKINFPIQRINIKNFKLYNIKYAVILFFFVSLFIPMLKKIEIKMTIYRTLTMSNRYSLSMISNKMRKLKQCFCKSDYVNDERYLTVRDVRNLITNNRSDYCLFFENDCYLYDLYGNGSNPWYELKGNFVAASLFGIPVINSLYIDNDGDLYRGDGKNMGTTNQLLYYGVGSVQPHNNKCTLPDMEEYARLLGKKYLILLTSDTYKVISLELDKATE